ncbi:MAG TPA: thiamine-phosphate kinase [Thermoanaerobaculia bacterium]|nr:thiamine-phosphate kinase [Thermoanaerobaculia bacterium]
MTTEAQLIERLRRHFPKAGDDAAVVGDEVITTDMLVENVDFTTAIPLRFIARKSLAVNLSDLAAMGATPSHAVVALAIPKHVDADQLVDAIAEAAKHHAIEIVGGDLSRSEKLVIAVTAVGKTTRPLLRSGAKAGDRIYVSRPLGAPAAGLALIQRYGGIEPPATLPYLQRELANAVIQRQIDPQPEVALGKMLGQVDAITSCIDISDGLSSDLAHLCEASNLGAEIEKARIPVFPELHLAGVDVGDAVLNGGEEYAMLFTSSLRESELSSRLKRPVYAIGRMSRDRGVKLDGNALEPRGWDHFA